MNKLPQGWAAAVLADLIARDGIFADGDWVESKDQDPNGSIRLLQLADVGDGVFLGKSNRFVNETTFERLRCTEVVEGDVLIARMPDPLGRACLAPRLQKRSITVVDVAIVRPGKESVKPTWLMRILNAPEIRQEIAIQSSGTTRRRISRGNLSQLQLPVAPLNEQKRIADKLDAVLARVNACREHLDRVPAILKRFRHSVLAAATSGKLTEDWREEHGRGSLEWETSTVGQLIAGIDSGINVRCDERPPSRGQRGLVKISAVTWGSYDDNESKTLPASKQVPVGTRIRAGDLLISRANTLEFVGACVIVNKVTRPVFLSDKVLRLVMSDGIKQWILIVLRSATGRKQIEDLSNGNQLSMRNLSRANLRSIVVPLPPQEEREEVVRRVESLFAYADRLEARYAAAHTQVQRLTPALLAKAFRGELVPQDPSDEPAAVLLERIGAARASTAPGFKPRKVPARKANVHEL